MASHQDLSTLDIRELATLGEYQDCVALQDATWGQGFSERVPGAILRVGQKIGGVSAGAFDREGRMVGFVFGLTGVRRGELVHWSDMLAVVPEWRSRHVGERLKRYQADRVRALGVGLMLWTYDPLMAGNANFNINRLGAFPREYVPDMYGSNTGSALHGALPTDRFIVEWDLTRDDTIPEGAGRAAAGDAGLPVANPGGAGGVPNVGPMGDVGAVRVQVPGDFAEIQRNEPACAAHWRYATRDACVALLERRYRVTRFVRAGAEGLPYYVFTRPEEAA